LKWFQAGSATIGMKAWSHWLAITIDETTARPDSFLAKLGAGTQFERGLVVFRVCPALRQTSFWPKHPMPPACSADATPGGSNLNSAW